MYSIRRRFGGKHHKDFQPERKWEVPREEVQVREKDLELNHGYNFEIPVCGVQEVNGKRVLMIKRGDRTGAMIDIWVTF